MPRLNSTQNFIRSGIILGCLILGAAYTSAQTGDITGKISDSVGYVIAGAEIKAVISSSDKAADKAAAPQTFRAISNNEGEFTISALPIGLYELEVKASGFKTLKEKVVVSRRQPTRIDLQLAPLKVCGDAKGPNISLAEKDKAEIINQVLKMEVQSSQFNGDPILLSNQNIKAAWVSAPTGQTITVLSAREIIMKAPPEGHLFYCHFSEFIVHGDCVAITLLTSGVTSEGEECNLCGGGSTYVFRKEAGVWKGKFFSGWIS